ncbi:hypothetical protein AR457_37675 [Streptomyces agglomeratus]|uniref:FtsK/SpoIIIE domain-containing protein n=1 Tax=Streptomyces agglomeratus TaxID=285458 RepID=UPI0008547470|nr:FtsK/SpoIIIE domain-containing protein [Streptomyces agglomeratus]OEJ22944.1 hypothetical protein AR457_37675 [Streptomyces agglomeratus]
MTVETPGDLEEEILGVELLPPGHPGPHRLSDEEESSNHRKTRTPTAAHASKAPRTASTAATVIRHQVTVTRTGAQHLAAEWKAWRTYARLSDNAVAVHVINRQHAEWKARQDRDAKAANAGITRLNRAKIASTRTIPARGRQPARHRTTHTKVIHTVKGQAARDVWERRLDKVLAREFKHTDPTPAMIAGRRFEMSRTRTLKARSTLALASAVEVVTWTVSPFTATLLAGATLVAAGMLSWLQGRKDEADRYEKLLPVPELAYIPSVLPAAVAALEQAGAEPDTEAEADTTAAATETDVADDDCPEAEQLNEVLRAVGILPKGENAPSVTVITAPNYAVGNGFEMTVDLPRGDGILVRHVLKKIDVIAGEYGISKMRIIAREIPPSEGGHGRRMSWWICEHDPYTHGEPTRSSYATADTANYWAGVFLGAIASGTRRIMPTELAGGLASVFVSGQQRFGKSTLLRLAAAAGVLSPDVRIYAANGKRGRDWAPLAGVAHRLVEGTSEEDIARFFGMLDELIQEMEGRYRDFPNLPLSLIPDGRLTPELARERDMPILALLLDELQVYVKAMTPEQRKEMWDKLGRLLLGGPAAGIVLWVGTQRAGADEIPTGFRDMFTLRASVRMPDSRSSKMALGDVAADAGADSSILEMDHVAVVILALGPAWEIIRMDRLNDADWADVCKRGRLIRQNHGSLSGNAAGNVVHIEPRHVRAVRDAIAVMDAADEDRGRLEDLADAMAAVFPAEWNDLNGRELGDLLRQAGAGPTSGLGPWRGKANPNGYKRTGLAKLLATTRKTA